MDRFSEVNKYTVERMELSRVAAELEEDYADYDTAESYIEENTRDVKTYEAFQHAHSIMNTYGRIAVQQVVEFTYPYAPQIPALFMGNNNPFYQGFVLGMVANRHLAGKNIGTTLTPYITELLSNEDSLPSNKLARAIVTTGITYYDNAIDPLSDGAPSTQRRRPLGNPLDPLARAIAKELYPPSSATSHVLFRTGIGITRKAYHNYARQLDVQFKQITSRSISNLDELG